MADNTPTIKNIFAAAISIILTYGLATNTNVAGALNEQLGAVATGAFLGVVLMAGFKRGFASINEPAPAATGIVPITQQNGGGIDPLATTAQQMVQRKDKEEKKSKPIPIPLQPPSPYDGTAEKAISYMAKVENYFEQQEENDIENKVPFVLNNMNQTKDRAVEWADDQWNALAGHAKRKSEGKDVEPVFENWVTFKETFLAHFSTHEQQEVAEQKIRTLEMGKLTCKEFTWKFKMHAHASGWDDTALLAVYKSALTKELRERVTGAWPIPVTLDDWYQRSMELDRAFRKELW